MSWRERKRYLTYPTERLNPRPPPCPGPRTCTQRSRQSERVGAFKKVDIDTIYLQKDHLGRLLQHCDRRHVPLVVVELERL